MKISELIKLIRAGKIISSEQVGSVEEGIDAIDDETGETLLTAAFKADNEKAWNVLLLKGANQGQVNRYGETFNLFFTKRLETKNPRLGPRDADAEMIQKGFEFVEKNFEHTAYREIRRERLDQFPGNEALINACKQHNFVVALLLAKERPWLVNVKDAKGDTPLMIVYKNFCKKTVYDDKKDLFNKAALELIRSLIAKGANVNDVDKYGNTLLHMLAIPDHDDRPNDTRHGPSDKEEDIVLEIERNIDKNYYFPLEQCSFQEESESGYVEWWRYRDCQIADILVKNGADISKQNIKGSKPVRLSYYKHQHNPGYVGLLKGGCAMTKFLVSRGEDPNQFIGDHRTLVSLAIDQDNEYRRGQSGLDFYLNHGANLNEAFAHTCRQPKKYYLFSRFLEHPDFKLNQAFHFNRERRDYHSPFSFIVDMASSSDNKNSAYYAMATDIINNVSYKKWMMPEEGSEKIINPLVTVIESKWPLANELTNLILSKLEEVAGDDLTKIVNIPDISGVTPILAALKKDDDSLELTKRLLADGAYLYPDALFCAVESGSIAKVRFLVERFEQEGDVKSLLNQKGRNGKSLLSIAIYDWCGGYGEESKKHKEKIVDYLIEKGADLSEMLLFATKLKYSEDVNFVLNKVKSNGADLKTLANSKDSDGESILLKSMQSWIGISNGSSYYGEASQQHLIEFLVANGADTSLNDKEILSYAFKAKTADGAELLLNILQKNDPDSLKVLVNQKDGDETQLFKALNLIGSRYNGNTAEKIIDFLIRNGADLNDVDGGKNILFCAVSLGSTIAENLLQILTKNKVDLKHLINQKDSEGNTPLMYAISKGNKAVIDFLIQNGADISVKNNKGENALMLAAQHSNPELIDRLIKKGADLYSTDKDGNGVIHFTTLRQFFGERTLDHLINIGCMPSARDEKYLLEEVNNRYPQTKKLFVLQSHLCSASKVADPERTLAELKNRQAYRRDFDPLFFDLAKSKISPTPVADIREAARVILIQKEEEVKKLLADKGLNLDDLNERERAEYNHNLYASLAIISNLDNSKGFARIAVSNVLSAPEQIYEEHLQHVKEKYSLNETDNQNLALLPLLRGLRKNLISQDHVNVTKANNLVTTLFDDLSNPRAMEALVKEIYSNNREFLTSDLFRKLPEEITHHIRGFASESPIRAHYKKMFTEICGKEITDKYCENFMIGIAQKYRDLNGHHNEVTLNLVQIAKERRELSALNDQANQNNAAPSTTVSRTKRNLTNAQKIDETVENKAKTAQALLETTKPQQPDL